MELFKKFSSIYISVAFLAFLVMIAITGIYQPMMADDYSFSNQIVKEDQGFLQYVTGFYNNWSGHIQSVPLHWFIFQNVYTRAIFNLLNSVVFFGFLATAFYLAVGRWPRFWKEDSLVFSLLLGAAWFGLPVIGEIFFWITGSVGYFWAVFFCLLFLVPYRAWLNNVGNYKADTENKKRDLVYSIIMFLNGVWVGGSSEQLLPAVSVFLMFLYFYIRKKSPEAKIPIWLKVGLMGLLTGGFIMIIAPGNYVRLDNQAEISIFERIRFFAGWTIKLFVIEKSSWAMYPWLAGIVLMFKLTKGENPSCLPREIRFISWLGAAFITLTPMFILTSFAAPRTRLFAVCFIIIAIVSLLDRDYYKRIKLYETKSLFISMLLVSLVLTSSYSLFREVKIINKEEKVRQQMIAKYQKQGKLDVVLPPYSLRGSRMLFISDITEDPMEWRNEAYTKWHGLKSIKLNSGN